MIFKRIYLNVMFYRSVTKRCDRGLREYQLTGLKVYVVITTAQGPFADYTPD